MAKALKPWEKRKISYQEWGKLDFDWENEYKLNYTVESYLFRFTNYHKGLKNPTILKSTFGKKSKEDILKEIDYWFNKCIGAYNQIELKQ